MSRRICSTLRPAGSGWQALRSFSVGGLSAAALLAASSAYAADGESFADRFARIYADHLNDNVESGPAPAYRGAPPPLSSPPFPFTNWGIGGTSNIGYPDTTTGPLLETLYGGPGGDWLKESRIKIYGWLNAGGNVSTSTSSFSISKGIGGNYPAAYSYRANRVQFDQFALFIDRTPDTVQTDHIDWGFRLANLYGADYKYTFTRGLLSQQYLKKAHPYGYDPMLIYFDLYIPYVAEGLNIRVGRYLSVPDIEAQLAPNNYMYSHSLLYSYDPYTTTGIIGSLRLTKNWTVQLGFSGGQDILPWDISNRKPTVYACVNWTSDSGNDNIYPCMNGVNDAKYAYNNMNHWVVTWYHKFNAKWHMATEAFYMYERGVPSVNSTLPTILGTNSAQCSPGKDRCFVSESAIVNYLNYQVGEKDFLSFRNELVYDKRGQRTLYKTLYSSHTLGWNHWIGDVITLRPELRYERSYQQRAYDFGRRKEQLMLAGDIIVHF
ncbi:MAG: hypothetical protein JWM77_1803 [Rhodospirillales bacterium]|nr:hypothetical protein [Rhodospirillales bacterium]